MKNRLLLNNFGGGGGTVDSSGSVINKKSYNIGAKDKTLNNLAWNVGINPHMRLRKQYEWLNKVGKMPDLREKFVRVFDARGNQHYYEYSMPELDGLTLSQLMQSGYDCTDKMQNLSTVAYFLRDNLHTKNLRTISGQTFMSMHGNKISNRIGLFLSEFPELEHYFTNDYISINGKEMMNLPLLLKKLEGNDDLLRMLNPRYTSMVHGDLHIGNIICLNQSDSTVMIDVRGVDAEPMYDIAKLAHSSLGGYDFCNLRQFQVISNSNESIDEVQIEFNVDSQVFSNYMKLNTYLLKLYKDVWLEGMSELQKESFVLQFIGTNASHNIGATPFQALDGVNFRDINDFLGVYTLGIYIFNKLFDVYNDDRSMDFALNLDDSPIMYKRSMKQIGSNNVTEEIDQEWMNDVVVSYA